MRIINGKSKMNKRIYQRKPYSGHIFYVAKNGFNEGRLKDFSHYGLFIITKVHLPVGEVIAIALPYLKNKNIKVRGQILRRTKEGFGIELFRNRSLVDGKIVKKEVSV
jgi:hypothetical protein